MEHGLVRRVAPRAERVSLGLARVGEERERLVRVGRENDLVVPASLTVLGHDLDPGGIPPHRAHTQPEVHLPAKALEQCTDIGLRPAADGSPAAASQPEHAVPFEEADPVGGGKIERPLRGARPERGRERNEEVAAESLRVAPLLDVCPERPSFEAPVAECALGGTQPAGDFAQEREEAHVGDSPSLRERFLPRPLETAASAAHGEGHLRGLRGDAELTEKAAEHGVVRLVVDDEARIEGEPVVPNRVHVAAGALPLLEELHVVGLRQHVGCAEPGHAATDDCHFHRTGIRLATKFGCTPATREPLPWI